jgi:hypothetical protein
MPKGKFEFDYGQFLVSVDYLSSDRLQWEQLRGPGAGLAGVETYRSVEVRPNVHLIWWQEKDTSVVSQVADFEKRRVFTNWISPEKKVEHFEGTIKPKS